MITSKKRVDYIKKMMKSLKDFPLLVRGASETIETEVKNIKVNLLLFYQLF